MEYLEFLIEREIMSILDANKTLHGAVLVIKGVEAKIILDVMKEYLWFRENENYKFPINSSIGFIHLVSILLLYL